MFALAIEAKLEMKEHVVHVSELLRQEVDEVRREIIDQSKGAGQRGSAVDKDGRSRRHSCIIQSFCLSVRERSTVEQILASSLELNPLFQSVPALTGTRTFSPVQRSSAHIRTRVLSRDVVLDRS